MTRAAMIAYSGLLSALCLLSTIRAIPPPLPDCNPWEFECLSGECIGDKYLCDGTQQCPDNSDESSCVNCVVGPWSDRKKVSAKHGVPCQYERTRQIIIPAGHPGRDCPPLHQTVRCTNSKCSTRQCSSDNDCSHSSFCGIHPSGKRDPTCCPKDPDALSCKMGKGRECFQHQDCNYDEYCLWDKMNRRSTCCPISPEDMTCPGLGPVPPLLCNSQGNCLPSSSLYCFHNPQLPYSYCCPPPPP